MTADAPLPPPARPFRRRVFYIPGYDPFHPRRYRELYRSEGAEQARISGYDLRLAPKPAGGAYGWTAELTDRGQAAQAGQADVTVLVWSDLVQSSMKPGIAQTYLLMLRTAWAYVGSGALFRLMRLRKGPMIAALYPVLFLTGQLGLALLTGYGFGLLVGILHPAAGWIAGAVLVWAMLDMFRRWDAKVFAYYLMHDYAYSAQAGGANPPALEARMAEFGRAIGGALAEDWDEVLLVGHSSGAHLGVSVLSDLIRAGLPPGHPPLGFLTLGQVVPMVSFLPRAHRLRRDLHHLSQEPALTWVDVTAPGDGCAFALCDPVAVSGVAPEHGQLWPLVVSAAFTQTLSPYRWRALRWRFFRLHFQYLCAFDRPGDYDYFRITAGCLTLADRFRGRAPSRSRVTRAANRFTSMAPP